LTGYLHHGHSSIVSDRRQLPIRLRTICFMAGGLTIFSTLMAYQLTRYWERPDTLMNLAAMNGAYWLMWGVFTPIIMRLAMRFRFDGGRWPLALAVHVPALVFFVGLHLAGMQLVRRSLVGWDRFKLGFWALFRNDFVQYLDWEMMTYWAITAVALAAAFYKESQDRAVRTAKLETRLVEAQLQTLQRQLQPHFLFNTLHAISTLMHRDVESADRMLSRLSELLRLTLNKVSQQDVPLSEEIDFLAKYLQIEQTRFQDRLTVKFDVEPEALDGLVPRMLLQPLVENAIKHGIAPVSGPGHIGIRAWRDGGHLLMEVADNGAGLSQDALTALQSGIGLSTTRARLQHLFGRDHQFEFLRQPRGLAVRVVIPWRPAEPAAELKPASVA
jgi:two-component system, LytTR family, sensor kinase